MNDRIRRFPAVVVLAGAMALTPLVGVAQNGAGKSSEVSNHDRWLHVRIENPSSKEETVRVNLPLELAEKILPTINRDRLHSGKVKIEDVDCHGVDLVALLSVVRTSRLPVGFTEATRLMAVLPGRASALTWKSMVTRLPPTLLSIGVTL